MRIVRTVGGRMTDQGKVQIAFDMLDNCCVHDMDNSLVLLTVDQKLWEEFSRENDNE